MAYVTANVIVLLVMYVATPCTFGFQDPNTGPVLPGDRYPVTANLLQCIGDDPGLPIDVGIRGEPGSVFKPTRSRYRYPGLLEDVSRFIFALVGIVNQLNITQNLQDISTPNFTTIEGYPLRYEVDAMGNPSADRAALQNICGSDVLAVLEDSDRNADQPQYQDIAVTLQEDWVQIWNNLTDQERTNIASNAVTTGVPTDPVNFNISWNSDQMRRFETFMLVLSCRAAFRWEDAGPTFIPRYFMGGFCLNRKCSLPDRDEFRCHADLSAEAVRYYEAARWDCCWTIDEEGKLNYRCGFRKVRFPIICDCDCRCPDMAGI